MIDMKSIPKAGRVCHGCGIAMPEDDDPKQGAWGACAMIIPGGILLVRFFCQPDCSLKALEGLTKVMERLVPEVNETVRRYLAKEMS